MKAVIQRVDTADVTVDDVSTGKIGRGILVLLGVEKGDTEKDAAYLAEKIINLRIFEDAQGKMNLSLEEMGGELLVVSQFTLLADCRKGRRPSFTRACEPRRADELYRHFVGIARTKIPRVATGEFQAMMKVHLVNDGPVTMILESGTARE